MGHDADSCPERLSQKQLDNVSKVSKRRLDSNCEQCESMLNKLRKLRQKQELEAVQAKGQAASNDLEVARQKLKDAAEEAEEARRAASSAQAKAQEEVEKAGEARRAASSAQRAAEEVARAAQVEVEEAAMAAQAQVQAAIANAHAEQAIAKAALTEAAKWREEAEKEKQRVAARGAEVRTSADGLSTLPVPQRFGRQVMVGRGRKGETLGAGGMGGVERMRHIGGAAVAVKTPMARQALPPAERHSYAAREVDNELRILHLCAPNPNVIHAFGAFGLAEDWPRFIMEAADTDLSKRIQSRVAWSTFELEQIALGVACGLERVHLVGVIHCDIKPQNVLLVGNVAKVADFGVACYRRPSEPGDETRTQPAPFPWLHDTGGTCTWFSPERAEAFWMLPESSNLRLSDKEDVWAFGCLLQAMADMQTAPCWLRLSGQVNDVDDVHSWFTSKVGQKWCAKASYPFEDVSVAATNRDPGARPTMAEVRGALAGKFQLPMKNSGKAACERAQRLEAFYSQ